jgi:hypothetical protein
VSPFRPGEQGARRAAARIVQGAPDAETKFYAANQAADEARHVEVYQRYLTEKLDRSFAVNDNLQTLLYETVSDSRWDMTFLGMQIMVEGLALAAFGLMRLQLPEEPLIQDITTRIMGDEARHVAFGVMVLERVYAELSSAEMREREEFTIEATHLMHDRLLMEEIFERMDFDVPLWIDWAKNTQFMRGFRQLLFSKIVPNVKRLGLLTPRVRSEYEKLGLLRFEHLTDSTQDSEPPPPEEMIALIAALREGGAAAS